MEVLCEIGNNDLHVKTRLFKYRNNALCKDLMVCAAKLNSLKILKLEETATHVIVTFKAYKIKKRPFSSLMV